MCSVANYRKEGTFHGFFLIYNVEAHIRANIKLITKGAGDKRGKRGKHKTVGNRDMRRSLEGRGMG